MWYAEMLNKIIPPKIATAEAKLIWQPVIYQLLKEENENLWNKTHTFYELHLEFSMCVLKFNLNRDVQAILTYSVLGVIQALYIPTWKSLVSFLIEDHRVVEIKETKRNNIFWCNIHSFFKVHFVSPNLQIICL